jgi:hypothetical protein
MGTRSKHAASTPELERARQRFEQWRRTRKRGARIPEPLWDSAVTAAEACGVQRTAATLALNYYSLNKRVKKSRTAIEEEASLAIPAAFLELAPPLAVVSECVLELEGANGDVMRVRLKNADSPDLAALVRAFRDARS